MREIEQLDSLLSVNSFSSLSPRFSLSLAHCLSSVCLSCLFLSISLFRPPLSVLLFFHSFSHSILLDAADESKAEADTPVQAEEETKDDQEKV